LARLYLVQDKKAQAEEYLRQAVLEFPSDSVGYRMLGDFYYATGDIDKAIVEYAGILRKHPKDLQAKKNYIQLLIQKARLDDAQKLNAEILNANPQDGEALVYRAQIQIAENHLVDATSTLEMATKNDPKDAAAHYYLGIAREKMGNLANAESEWGEAARLRPDLVDAQLALAGAAMRRGDMSALEEVATRIINLRPGSADGYALRAVSSMNRKSFREADDDVRRAIDVAPQSAAGYVQLGNLRVLEKRYGDATKAYQDGLDRDANSIDALRGIVGVDLSQDELEQAIRIINTHLVASPNNSDFYDLLGTVMFQNKKDLNGAEAAFRRSVELNRDNIDAWIEMGQVQAAMGRVERAIATYQEAIQEHPGQANLYLLLGELLEAQHDWKNAQAAYQNALRSKPADPLASNNLANVILESGGDLDTALSLAQTARRGLPDSPDVADTLGWIYYQKGAYKSAIGLLQEAIKLAEKNKIPENPDFHYHLGLAYEKTAQFALARQHLERVLKIKPDYVDGANVRQQLARLQS
ncbi:MAG TPA: tetratricopeptide repeat protein, partial [Terriglobales bacterium]|nr:tetratricopeptide repeat protein [Terriglobales bacterium]